MPGTDALYELTAVADEVQDGLPLVVGLTGFADAGGAVAQVTEHLLESITHRVVARFDNDTLLDYRARRPIISFEQDRLTDYTPPRLELSLAEDDVHRPFLLLSGYEPDFGWERFVAAVIDLGERFAVSGVTWVHAIPMPVPHTRPIGVTVSGNRSDLIESLSVWRPHTQVAANVLHVLEYRLAERGSDVTGFALLVPHYLADTEYPDSAVAALDSISSATGLILPSDELRGAGREFVSRIDEQVAGNEELARLVTTLEQRYDAYMEGTSVRSPLTDEDGELPSADAIADELEQFLAGRRSGDDDFPGRV
ncbi:putative ATP-grasp superfamily ATP-dependent carboligase [Labedella gwakjiensis]|uniref:PAC2 family protein n=1 Tax=Labedella gwakjiensis TaxID=390269 RepID=A0A2P8GZQ2_9MICO|nr:PAC2 family protein [Labedella gwakjiensis]PSL39420.1 putative ATP-grasp superfamily ATP-dependent carboligase [Labedella gwakjiensis]RUQ86174.1 PAC2 family protein [Labedella gwakjiensis]